jgi:uncharacterized protein (DUF885 family)
LIARAWAIRGGMMRGRVRIDMTRRELLAAGLALGVAPIASGIRGHARQQGARTIADFFREITDDWVRHDPTLATSNRYFTGDEQDMLERQLTPRTIEWRRDRIRRAHTGLVELGRFDRSGLSDVLRVSADLLQWQLAAIVESEPFLDFTFPLEQMNGANVTLVDSFTIRRTVQTDRDAENYVATLPQVAMRMDESTENARRLADRKVIPPRFILAATIRQMRAFADMRPAQNPFVATFADRLSAIRSLAPARRQQLQADAEKILVAEIYPAWKRAVELLEGQVAQATDDAGLWRLPGGPDAYAYFLRYFTTTPRTANDIHEIGLMQVSRLEAEMDRLLRQIGRTDGTVKDRIAKLKLDMQYPNPRSEQSREQIMKDIDGIIRDAERRAALLFDRRPTSPVVARPFPAFREANAAANYNAPAPDGSRPGTFQFPRRVEMMTRFGLRSIVYHETVPGHHFHIALQTENKQLPRFVAGRLFGGISAITEGWGLYAERLAAESGWYGDDIEGRLGQLDYELFRARRLVVDTGIHAKKWTRQQGIDYGIEASEVERYVVYAGQACSYMMGELKLLELREKAKRALGERFSLRDYHNVVLTTGAVPLDVLEREVDRFVKGVRSA